MAQSQFDPFQTLADGKPEGWERELIERLASSALTEQRRARRWGIFFKFLLFLYLFALLAVYLPEDWLGAGMGTKKHSALVDVSGVIADDGAANADDIITGLRDAFDDHNTEGVILRINSPGGSPVQAGYVYDEIRRLRREHPDVKLYAVISDTGASGAYYIASAADAIYADKASIVGSIGVLIDGFGFVDTLQKLGVERRLMTAGDHKGFLDPFSPVRPEDQAYAKEMLETIHAQFIASVKQGRGDRLKEDPKLFSGLVWAGEEAFALGLVDGLGSAGYVAREVIGAEDIVDYTTQPDVWQRLADRIGVAMAEVLGTRLGLGEGRLR